MEKSRYKDLVKKNTPKEDRLTNGVIAFLTGGLMGAFGEFLLQMYSYFFSMPTKEASVFMIVTLIGIGCLLTCLGFFDKWVHFARCGLIIPITGFAHSMQSAAL